MIRDVTFQIGKDVIVGLLPTFPDGIRLYTGLRRAYGYTAADDRAQGDADDGVIIEASNEANYEDIQAIYWACVGMCWPARLECPTFRDCGRDPVDYGEWVITELRSRGYSQLEAVRAGHKLYDEILKSWPAPAEVDEEAANFPDPAESSVPATA